jgi:hypothetical protein
MTSSETYYKMKLNLEGFKNVQGLMLLRTVNAGFPPPHPSRPLPTPSLPLNPFSLFRVQRDFNINSLLNETNVLMGLYRVGAKYSCQQIHMATMA